MFDGLSTTWSPGLGVIIFLLVLTLLYLLGLRQLRQAQILHSQTAAISTPRMFAFFVAILIAALLLLTPINTIARTQLFTFHMAQSVILTTICAPLILAGCSANLLQPILKMPVVRFIWGLLTNPLVSSVLFNLNFLLWHAPNIFNAAMQSGALYDTMMLSIFFTSLLNWWPLLGSLQELRRINYPMQMLYAFFDGQPVDIFAFILVFTGVSLYTHYAIPPQLHLSAFSDQAIGGALLLIPGFVDLGVMTPLFFRWLGQIEHKTILADERRQTQFEEYEYEEEEERAEAQ